MACSRDDVTDHEEEADAHHLGRPLQVVMGQASPLDQLLGDDVTDAHQRPCDDRRRVRVSDAIGRLKLSLIKLRCERKPISVFSKVTATLLIH